MVIITQSAFVIPSAWKPDTVPDYNLFILPSAEHCSISSYPKVANVALIDGNVPQLTGMYSNVRAPIKWWLDCLSYQAFGTPKLIPILFNLGLMPLVYLLALRITKDKIVSLLSFAAFLSNPLYIKWIDSGTYDQIWTFFLMLSVYFILNKKPQYSIPSFVASAFSKSLALLYLPAILHSFFESRSNKEWYLLSLGLGVGIAGLALLFYGPDFWIGGSIGFHPDKWQTALYDGFWMLLPEFPFIVIPGYIAMTYRPKVPTPGRKISAVWITNAFLTTPLIYLFTNQFQFVYRFVPLAIFMSILIGIAIVDTARWFVERRLEPKVNQKLE